MLYRWVLKIIGSSNIIITKRSSKIVTDLHKLLLNLLGKINLKQSNK